MSRQSRPTRHRGLRERGRVQPITDRPGGDVPGPVPEAGEGSHAGHQTASGQCEYGNLAYMRYVSAFECPGPRKGYAGCSRKYFVQFTSAPNRLIRTSVLFGAL